MPARVDRFVQRLRKVRRLRALVRAVRWAADAVRIRWLVVRSRRTPDPFDRAHGVQTRVATTLGELLRNTRHGGYDYEPSPSALFRDVLASLDIDVHETVFVDYGSGAGRVVLLASQLPFKAVVGIEVLPRLHACAQANVAALQATGTSRAPIRLICGDAATFELPLEPLLLYFFNPFRAATMGRVLSNIERSLRRAPRPITLVALCCDADARQVLEASPHFALTRTVRGATVLRSAVASTPPTRPSPPEALPAR